VEQQEITEGEKPDEIVTAIYFQKVSDGADVLLPGGSPTFAGVKSKLWKDKLNFISLMLALFCGTASLPHILIRYYTVKDQASARKAPVVGIASIGFFYILTVYLGLGAMTSGAMDVTNSNMSAPLLAKSFGPWHFAIISAIAFTTVLGTVSGLIIAASGAVAHDIMTNYMQRDLSDHEKVRAGKIAAVVVGILAMILGIVFKSCQRLVPGRLGLSTSPPRQPPRADHAAVLERHDQQGITYGIFAGLGSSLIWIFLSADAYKELYKTTAVSPMPFTKPGLVTIPLGFAC